MAQMGLTYLCLGTLISYCVYVVRLIWILPFCKSDRDGFQDGIPLRSSSKGNGALNVFLFLGSGGHTGEMIRLLENYHQLLLANGNTLLVGYSDQNSRKSFEKLAAKRNLTCKIEYYEFIKAREVNASLVRSLVSVFHTLLDSCIKTIWISLKFSRNPHLVLLNGPGTCCILALWFKIIEWVNLVQPRTNIVYIESLARTSTLSLSGKILYRLADTFVVQWEELRAENPRAKHYGILV